MGSTGEGLGGYLGGLYRYPARTSLISDIEVRTERYPYPRPNEGNSQLNDEVPQMGLRMGPDMASEWVQIWPPDDPQDTLPDWPPDDPQITHIPTSGTSWSRIGVISPFYYFC